MEISPSQSNEFRTELLGQFPERSAVLGGDRNSFLVGRVMASKIERDPVPGVQVKFCKLQRRFKVRIAIPEFDKKNFFQNGSLAGASRTPYISPGKMCQPADQ